MTCPLDVATNAVSAMDAVATRVPPSAKIVWLPPDVNASESIQTLLTAIEGSPGGSYQVVCLKGCEWNESKSLGYSDREVFEFYKQVYAEISKIYDGLWVIENAKFRNAILFFPRL